MDRFAAEDVRAVLKSFGVESSRRATTTDSTEEVILISQSDFDRVDVEALTLALMNVLPHTKVWVAPNNTLWSSEDV